MSENLKDNAEWIVMALGFKFGWALGWSTWRAVIGVASSLGGQFLDNLTAGLLPADRAWLSSMLDHRAWRMFAALFRAASGVKLPSLESVNIAAIKKAAASGDTAFIAKPTAIEPSKPSTP